MLPFVPKSKNAHLNLPIKVKTISLWQCLLRALVCWTTIAFSPDQILTLRLTLTSHWISCMIISAHMHRTISCPSSVKLPPTRVWSFLHSTEAGLLWLEQSLKTSQRETCVHTKACGLYAGWDKSSPFRCCRNGSRTDVEAPQIVYNIPRV